MYRIFFIVVVSFKCFGNFLVWGSVIEFIIFPCYQDLTYEKVSVRDMELWVPYAVKYHFCDRDCHPHLKCLCMTNTILLYYFWLISCDCSRKLRCRTNKCHLCGAMRMRPIPILWIRDGARESLWRSFHELWN